MTFDEYQKLASRTINKSLTDTDKEAHVLLGLASETGELLGLYQKSMQGHEFNDEHMLKECGDILWMLAELLTAKGYTLDDVARMNIDKLRARYPDGFDTEHSLHRGADDI
jgi:NTP pyrophosphatase (non-canonical NTP hydrolase)